MVNSTDQVRPALILNEKTVNRFSLTIKHLVTGLLDISVRPVLVCPEKSQIDQIVSFGHELITYPAVELPLLGQKKKNKLIQQLSDNNVNVLHFFSDQPQLLYDLPEALELPFINSVSTPGKKHLKTPQLIKKASFITSPADSITERLRKIYPKYSSKIKTVPFGAFVETENTCFSGTSEVAGIVLAEENLKSEKVDKFFRAMKRLATNNYDFMLVIIEQKVSANLRKQLAQYHLLPKVVRVPKISTWRDILRSGDIFIRLSADNFFNPLLLEAMATGNVIAGVKGGVDDLLIESKTAEFFDASDEISIYKTLKNLLDQKDYACKLSANAHDAIKQKHSVTEMTERFVDIYRTTLAGATSKDHTLSEHS